MYSAAAPPLHPSALRLVVPEPEADAREARRLLLPGDGAVADEDARHAGKAEEGGHRLQVVLAVDEVRRLAQGVQRGCC
jgi:hypothetical protein